MMASSKPLLTRPYLSRSISRLKRALLLALILTSTRLGQVSEATAISMSEPTTVDWHQKQQQHQQHDRQQVHGNQEQQERQVATSTNRANMTQDTNRPISEETMKFPLYMRILATLACLIIFTIGVCGNLLVPLVVIKTKYLRNSTNLFLINLSMADLLVLIVCMPTVLIELHSRPETWPLGEPMCKLSNYVEMLAANGSIFTILAISFERYYAICKPLKAGYKCTRFRATIIICLIWLLASILTSPILIMAKSSETSYIDGSLVYNCILETDTYWHKMYVFVSMFAFFGLPLIVLMLVYWLIGRRLFRENLAMSTTTSITTTASQVALSDSSENHNNSTRNNIQQKFPIRAIYQHKLAKRVSLKKAASLKSISAFFAAALHNQQSINHYHHFTAPTAASGNLQHQQQRPASNSPNQRPQTASLGSITYANGPASHQNQAPAANGGRQLRRKFAINKALSLDQHLMVASSGKVMSPETERTVVNRHDPEHPAIVSEEDDNNSQFGCEQRGRTNKTEKGSQETRALGVLRQIKISLAANRFVHQLFHTKSMPGDISANKIPTSEVEIHSTQQHQQQTPKTANCSKTQQTLLSQMAQIQANGFTMNSISELHASNCRTTGSDELSNEELASREPFLPAAAFPLNKTQARLTDGLEPRKSRKQELEKALRAGKTVRKAISSGLEDGKRIQTGIKSRKGSKFKWAKGFSVSSSTTTTSSQATNLTGLISECSSVLVSAQPSPPPKPIIHCGDQQTATGSEFSSRSPKNQQQQHHGGGRKFAHFNDTTNRADSVNATESGAQETSCCESAATTFNSSTSPSPCTSKSPSPDSISNSTSRQQHQIITGSPEDTDGYPSTPRLALIQQQQHLLERDNRPAALGAVESLSSRLENDSEIDRSFPKVPRQMPASAPSSEAAEVAEATNNYDSNEDEDHVSLCLQMSSQTDGSANHSIGYKKGQLQQLKNGSLDSKAHEPTADNPHQSHFYHFKLRRANRFRGSQPTVCSQLPRASHISELIVVQDLSKKQQIDSRRQVVIMLAFVVACFFLLFFPYRVFTIWLILSTEDQVQSLGMETYYNLTYFSRILIYLHSAINPIAYNLISTKFRRAFMSILLCRGSSTRRHFTTDHRIVNKRNSNTTDQAKPLRQSNQ